MVSKSYLFLDDIDLCRFVISRSRKVKIFKKKQKEKNVLHDGLRQKGRLEKRNCRAQNEKFAPRSRNALSSDKRRKKIKMGGA